MLAFALAQILVHMIYFLHMTPKAEGGWLLLSTVFTIILVVITLGGLALDHVPPEQEHDAGHGGHARHGSARLPVTRAPADLQAAAGLHA